MGNYTLIWSGLIRVMQIITYTVLEKGMEYKEEQRWALVEPWCKRWNWQKGTSLNEMTLNSEEIKPLAIASIELHLTVSESVSQSVENSVK